MMNMSADCVGRELRVVQRQIITRAKTDRGAIITRGVPNHNEETDTSGTTVLPQALLQSNCAKRIGGRETSKDVMTQPLMLENMLLAEKPEHLAFTKALAFRHLSGVYGLVPK